MSKDIIKGASSENNSMLSPYYLHPSDNPGVSISPVLLTRENHGEWSSEFENALRAKRKIGFIDGTLKMPSEIDQPAEAEMWKTVNSMIVGWMRASITPATRSTVTFTPDALKMGEI